ncbi:MAG: hypothetical protein WD533_04610 [Dehalococcoidia bacterium]
MKRRFLLVMSIMSALALALTGVVAAQQPPSDPEAEGTPTPEQPSMPGETPTPSEPPMPGQQQGDGEWAVVALEEQDDSGYQGIVALRGSASGSETEAIVAVMSTNGDAEVGQAAIIQGSCDDPSEVVEELGELSSLEGQNAEVLAASAPMGMEELLSGGYVIGVLEGEAGGEEITTIACGELTEDSRVQQEGSGSAMPETPEIPSPGGTPEPGETPEPGMTPGESTPEPGI